MKDFWQRLKEAVGGILGAMTGPQRLGLLMLVAALASMVGWTIQTAGGPAERLLVSSREPDDVRADAVDALTAKQIKHTLRDGSIYVAPEDHDTAKYELIGEGVFSGSKIFDWLNLTNITATNWQNHMRWRVSKEKQVAGILKMNPSFERVEVTYNPPTSESILNSTGASGASASVNILPKRNHDITTQEAIAIASVVVGAVPDLKRERVEIIDLREMKHIPVPGVVGELWESYHLRDVEKKVRETVEAQIKKLYPHFSVSAMVKLNADSQKKFDQKTDQERTEAIATMTKTLDHTRNSIGGAPSTLEKGSTTLNTGGGITEKKSLSEKENTIAPTFGTVTSDLGVGNLIEKITVAVLIPEILLGTLDQTAVRTKVENHIKALGAIVDAKSFSVSVETMPSFVTAPPIVDDPWWRVWGQEILATVNWTTLLSLLVVVIGFVLVYKLVRFSMEPSELREMQKNVAVAGGEGPELIDWGQSTDTMAEQVRGQVREMVQKNPRAVAGVLKRWMTPT